jgi:16S rRNA (guanine527-N7)-methyltransferase
MQIPDALRLALELGQQRGSVGPEVVEIHVARALAFFAPGAPAPGALCLDLGSGGGLPGLPLAVAHPHTRWTLLDARQQRVDDLRRAVDRLGIGHRVTVVHARAEDAGRGPERGTYDVVVARSFGPPARTAEYAAPFLRPAGALIVSVRAEGASWPAQPIPALGLGAPESWTAAGMAFRRYPLERPVDDRYPRRPQAQARHPLF